MLHNTKNITSTVSYGSLYGIVKNTPKFLKSSKILKNVKRKRYLENHWECEMYKYSNIFNWE